MFSENLGGEQDLAAQVVSLLSLEDPRHCGSSRAQRNIHDQRQLHSQVFRGSNNVRA
jgi:hypothetical protein